jgi:hypothetical protein
MNEYGYYLCATNSDPFWRVQDRLLAMRLLVCVKSRSPMKSFTRLQKKAFSQEVRR